MMQTRSKLLCALWLEAAILCMNCHLYNITLFGLLFLERISEVDYRRCLQVRCPSAAIVAYRGSSQGSTNICGSSTIDCWC